MDRTPPTVPDDLRQARWVLHVDMDAFFASCEQLARPTLAGRPVLVGGLGGRGVVAGASYEARKFGARSAMPIGQARRAVGPTAVVLPPRREIYSAASARVFGVIRRFFPVLEQLSIDEGYGEPPELAGATVGEVRAFAARLREAVREETGLPASVGAGAGKQYAKIASDLAKPDGVFVVPEARHAEIIHPLPVRSLWGIGPVAGQKLSLYGVTTVGELAAMSGSDASAALGNTLGGAMLAMARGNDPRPVHEPDIAKQISSEFTVATDLRSPEQIADALAHASAAAHRRLLRDGRLARTVTVKVKLTDFQIISRSSTMATATEDLDTIVAVARSLAPDPRTVGAVRLVGVSLAGLTSVAQPSLFESSAFPPRGYDAGGTVPDESSDFLEPMDPPRATEPVAEPTGGSGESDGGEGGGGAGSDTNSQVREGSGEAPQWRPGDDVHHPDFGHGWVQGAGHGWVSIRFETRVTGPGKARSLRADDPDLESADPLDSLAWTDLGGGETMENDDE